MTNAIKLLDVVALTVDLLEYNLWRGQVGTVVEILAGAPPLKSNAAIVKGVPTNRSGCVRISSWCGATSLLQRSRSLKRVHQRASITPGRDIL
jgi:hypothetical protein